MYFFSQNVSFDVFIFVITSVRYTDQGSGKILWFVDNLLKANLWPKKTFAHARKSPYNKMKDTRKTKFMIDG